MYFKYMIETSPWRLEETCCHSNSNEKPSANTDVKNSRGVNNNNNNNNSRPEDQTKNNQQKKRTSKIVNFAVLADHRIKLKGKRRSSTSTLLGN